MAWEERNGNRYYYTKMRIGDRVVSQYFGNGELAQAIAKLSELDRERIQLERTIERDKHEEIRTINRQVNEVCTAIRNITKAALLATGHHQHKGQWRKRRMTKRKTAKKQKNEASEFLTRLQKGRGTAEDIERFNKSLKDGPNIIQLFDLAENAKQAILRNLAGDNQALKLANSEKLEIIKNELGYDQSSQLERLLIEQIVLCNLRLYWVENLMIVNMKQATMLQVQHWEKRLSANQRRYFRAIETLARVRKLASRTPEILQVNIAQNQVNQANTQ